LKASTHKSELLLLLAAIIWGFSFVAQRAGMEHVGPFTFNGVRFALGSLSLLPFIFFFKRKSGNNRSPLQTASSGGFVIGGLLLGTFLFIASSFQQVGIVYTTAGNAGFITGLYMIFVPIFGIFIKKRTSLNIWIAAIIALAGMYLLSVNEQFSVGYGDLLVLVAAAFYAVHVLLVGHYAPKTDNLKISAFQFAICSFYSLAAAFTFEDPNMDGIIQAAVPILYGGVFSVGIAYTLQVIGQKKAHPAPAAIILSLETVFAVFGGWLILNEEVSVRTLFGCFLMLIGMVLAQIKLQSRRNSGSGKVRAGK
jgi:drug/metabolite transporter (DMT)-like permease